MRARPNCLNSQRRKICEIPVLTIYTFFVKGKFRTDYRSQLRNLKCHFGFTISVLSREKKATDVGHGAS